MVSSKPRAHMPTSRRAKIYAPFDALKGLKEAIAAKEIIRVPKIELEEDRKEELNRILIELKKGQMITVVYYCSYEENYLQLTGTVAKVEAYWHLLQIDNICIDFSDIYNIIHIEMKNPPQ